MPKFLLMLSDTPITFSRFSLEEHQNLIAKYRNWSRKLAEAGKLHGGQKLKDEGGKVMTQKGGQVSVVDGPYSETKEIIGGYFLIEARDYEDAVAISRDCPHLAYGKIDIRQIDEMP
jgi:hypothetical protein